MTFAQFLLLYSPLLPNNQVVLSVNLNLFPLRLFTPQKAAYPDCLI